MGDRIGVLGACLVALFGLASPRPSGVILGAEPVRPNVLMICVDDLNDWVGALGGHPQARTPHIDALARRGRLFSNAHCVVPVCSASRISVISGLHATTHGSYELGPGYTDIARLNDAPTLHAVFRRGGYTTVTGGKVLHHGFVGRLANDIDVDFDKAIGRRRGGPRPKQPLHWSPQVWDWGAYPERDDQMFDYQLATAASEWLRQSHDAPFFLSIGFFRPHVPMYVPPRWFAATDRPEVRAPQVLESDVDDVPANFRNLAQVAPTHQQVLASKSWRDLTVAYLASVAFADHCVGRLLEGLDQGPHRDSTIVVLWSDHGFHLGEKQHWAKRTLWEESTRCPLIFAGPGISPGSSCREAVSLLDVFPTLVELCRLEAPRLDGASLAPQLRRPDAPRGSPVLISSCEGNHAVRSRDWRYIRYADGAEELYDHRVDANEHRNLASDPNWNAVQSRLAKSLPRRPAPEVLSVERRRRIRERATRSRRTNRRVR